MGELVPHAGNVDPGDVRLLAKHLWGDPLDRFAYLDQPESDRIEHEAVVERSPLQIVGDRRQSISNVGKPFVIVSTHREIDSDSACALKRGRMLSSWNYVDVSVQEIGQLPLEGSERDQSNAWI